MLLVSLPFGLSHQQSPNAQHQYFLNTTTFSPYALGSISTILACHFPQLFHRKNFCNQSWLALKSQIPTSFMTFGTFN
jgi:hypothetical protein